MVYLFFFVFFTLIKIVLQSIFFAQEQKIGLSVLQSSIYVMEYLSVLMDLMKQTTHVVRSIVVRVVSLITFVWQLLS